MPEGFSITKIEAKAGKDGSWQDVTGNGSISITGNQTVYVRVTDGEGRSMSRIALLSVMTQKSLRFLHL